MIRFYKIKEFAPEMYSVFIESCTSLILKYILDPAVPFVRLYEHHPFPISWQKVDVPLSASGKYYQLEVRHLTFDLRMPTAEFLDLLPEFAGHGIDLVQSFKPLPDTLRLDHLRPASQAQVWKQNGVYLRFFLPHRWEITTITSPHPEVLEQILEHPIFHSNEGLP